MSEISYSSKVSPFVNRQVPEFVRIDHPTFVAFLNTYYEWLETRGAKLNNVLDLGKVSNVDETFEEFLTNFKNQYLLDFPETLAINQDTGEPVEVRTLIKHIKQFYQAKGTEKTYEFLFRILYDTNVEFYYPKVDILKASDGKWIQKKTIRVPGTKGSVIYESAGRRIYQRNASGVAIASASVVEVTKFQLGSFPVYELTLSNINGNFYTIFPIEFETSGQKQIEPKIYSVISAISITNGGSNYRVGDTILFTNATGDIGQGAKAKVSQVSSTGRILKIKIENFGVNYTAAPTITVQSNTGSGFAGSVTVGAICNFEGYYANNDGRLSTNKVLQDNHYYQNYSYVLKTELVIDRYKDAIKRLIHPAGLGFFGQVLIKRCAKSDLDSHTALIRYEVPILGHYLPYTLKTYDDLSQWFVYGGTAAGYSIVDHESDIKLCAIPGNPISSGKTFFPGATADLEKEVGFPRADPFWIIYQHPNRRITDTTIAKIKYGLTGAGKDDFLAGSTGGTSWSEWTMTADNLRESWASSFTGGYKYAMLRYNETSEFRKITAGAFLRMPIYDEYDCRYPNGVKDSHGNSPNF